MSKVTYSVDGKDFHTDTPETAVSNVLERAGKAPDTHCLILKDAEYLDPDRKIKIRDGDRFETKVWDIHYKVNGEEQTTEHCTLTVEKILRNAGRAASIDVAQIGDYYLESIDDGRKYENLADQVTIKQEEQFLALHRGKTPVA